MKVYLRDLKDDQVLEIIQNNDELYNLVEETYIRLEMNYIQMIMDEFIGVKHYEYGFYTPSIIRVNIFNLDEIAVGIERVTDNFGFFRTEKANELVNMAMRAYEGDDWEEKDRVKEIIQEEIENELNNYTRYTDDDIVDFIDSMGIVDLEYSSGLKDLYIYDGQIKEGNYKVYREVCME